ncbi:MAG: hypothetical protein GKS00_20825 [Alphaproteobacteria bacterium]|nr:hypothetical protein [Alphaproteobacteria bacterium]
MHLSRFFAAAPATLALLFVATQANAALINYQVNGTISGTSAAVTEIGVGDPFSVNLIIDTTNADILPAATLGAYFGSVTEFSFSVGAFSGGSNQPNGITFVKNGDSGVDGLNFVLFPTFGDTPDGLPFGPIELLLEDADLALLASDNLEDALAADSNIFQDLRTAEFALGLAGEGGFPELVAGTIEAAGIDDQPIPIPGPATLGLFAVGVVGLGFIGRRRKRHD